MDKKTKELIIFALNFLESNTDSESVQERLEEITGCKGSSELDIDFARIQIGELNG